MFRSFHELFASLASESTKRHLLLKLTTKLHFVSNQLLRMLLLHAGTLYSNANATALTANVLIDDAAA